MVASDDDRKAVTCAGIAIAMVSGTSRWAGRLMSLPSLNPLGGNDGGTGLHAMKLRRGANTRVAIRSC
jgi:hypothetical protein